LTSIDKVDVDKLISDIGTERHGTNTYGGLLKARDMLSEDESISDNESKYLVFMSDGINYCWSDPNNADKVYTSYYERGSGNTSTTSLSVHIANGEYNYKTPTLKEVMANTSAYEASTKYWHEWSQYTYDAPIAACIPTDKMASTMSSVEVGAYLTTKEFENIVNTLHYKTVTLYWTYDNSSDTNGQDNNPEYVLCGEMMKYFASLGKGYDITTSKSSAKAFSDLKQDISLRSCGRLHGYG
jgi:hypothetical protein